MTEGKNAQKNEINILCPAELVYPNLLLRDEMPDDGKVGALEPLTKRYE